MNSNSSYLAPSKRDPVIDLLRGFCLVVMTIDHLPHTFIERFTWQTFGFVSAAEAFVFLSGIVTGLVYGRSAIAEGLLAATKRAFRRARNIYLADIAFLSCAILAAREGIIQLEDGYQPGWSLWAKSMLLLSTPGYSAILQLYVALFLIVPLILWALLKNRVVYCFVISFALWALAAAGHGMNSIPHYNNFDVLSWQILFVTGICLGYPGSAIRKRLPHSRSWAIANIAVVIIFFVIRHSRPLFGFEPTPYLQWLRDWRCTLSAGRLVNFGALSYVVFRWRNQLRSIAKTAPGKFLAFLGAHSLWVFLWSISISTVIIRFGHRWSDESRLLQLALEMLISISCLIPAFLHSHWQSVRKSVPVSALQPKLIRS